MNTIWKVDPVHSSINFMVRHLVVAKVRGRFRGFEAEVTTRGEELDLGQVDVVATIDATTIDTGNEGRDADLKSVRFFDAENHPNVVFRSRGVEAVGEGRYRLLGELTIRDCTRDVTLEVESGGFVTDPWGCRRVGFTATGAIKRSDFGMTWNEVLDTGGVAVGDRVEIGIELEAVAQAPKAAVA